MKGRGAIKAMPDFSEVTFEDIRISISVRDRKGKPYSYACGRQCAPFVHDLSRRIHSGRSPEIALLEMINENWENS